jgi:3-oxoadipate enol-lactonase
MVVICTSARLGPASMWAQRAELVDTAGMAAVAPGVVARWFTPERQRSDPALVSWAEDMVASQPAVGYAACCRVIEAMDLRPVLPFVVAPLLAIAGTRDPATPPDHLRDIAAHVADGRLAEVDAAHLANLEQPAAVSALILDHLSEPGG